MDDLDIIGCYGQTEIGHGSDVQGIKTTATYDKAKREFVINTPSADATKWWPGGMGRVCNYSLILARVLIPEDDGDVNEYSLGMFLVQCRDLNTHKLMPGVKAGDIGNKMGYNCNDNGWMSFDNVRVPHEDMLSRFTSIDDEGCFSLNGNPKMIFIIMLRTRIMLFTGCWATLLLGSMIGVRYSIVRR